MLPFFLPVVVLGGLSLSVALLERLRATETLDPSLERLIAELEEQQEADDVVVDFNHPSQFDWVYNKE